MLTIIEAKSGLLIRGVLNVDTVIAFITKMEGYIKSGAIVQCDFAAVDSCDQAGISSLVLLVRTARRQSCKLMLQNLPAKVITLLKLSNLTTVLQPELGQVE